MSIQSGSEILRAIDDSIARLRNEVDSMDQSVQSANVELGEVGARTLSAYRQLAEIRLEQLQRGDVIAKLDATSQRVRELLQRREQTLAALGEELQSARRELEALEQEREQQRGRVETLATRIDEVEAEVQARLEQDAAYGEQLARAQGADATADEAEAKTAQAEEDRSEKGKPYEADPLFIYLWKRHYGTSEYSAFGFTRWLDRWVARLCRFDAARANYWMLQEIPVRLRAHAERVRGISDREFERLKTLEDEAGSAAGLPALVTEHATQRGKLDELDDSIEAVEEKIAALLERRAEFASGEDPEMRNALEVLTEELRGGGIRTLEAHARATPGDTDDRLVAQIADYEMDRNRLAELLEQNKRIHTRHVGRLRELENVRRQFKRRDYDDMRSVFTNAPLIALVLNEFFRGVIDGDDLWRALSRQQRFRRAASRPTFGSGGFPHRTGSWRIPRSGGWNFPRTPGGFGGGGFKTGGGFGRGGGFKTGGGF